MASKVSEAPYPEFNDIRTLDTIELNISKKLNYIIDVGGIDGVKADLEHVNSGTECQQCIFLLFQIEFM